MIDLAQAEAFIETLTGSPTTAVVFQLADDVDPELDRREPRKDLVRVFVGTVREHAQILGRMNEIGAGLWVQINAGRRGNRNVTALRACFVDDDGKREEPPAITLAPSIVVASSATSARKRHFYWLLHSGEAVERFTPTQKQLIAALGTDKSINDLSRCMRLPGSFNMKRANARQGEPSPVRLLFADAGRRFTIDQLLAAYPVPESEQRALLAEPQPELFTEQALGMSRRIAVWLTERGVTFMQPSPISFRLSRCVFNPEHREKLMLRVQSRGGVWGGCFHDSCGGNSTNKWNQIKDRIGGWAQGTIGFARGDDAELAARMLADLGRESEEPLVHAEGELWRYSSGAGLWAQLDDAAQERVVLSYAGLPIGDKRRLGVHGGTLAGTIKCARALASAPKFFAEAAPGISFTNGFLAVTPAGAAFMPHAPEHHQRVGLPFAYDARALCGRFFRYLTECFRDDDDAEKKIDLLQEFLGACLVGVAPRFQKALMLTGDGDNGKSVFASIAMGLFPPSMRQAIKPQDFGSEYYRARLAGARINIVAETPEAEILSSDSFKAIVSGDWIMGRDPAGRPFLYQPVAGQVFVANKLPSTSDHTHGFWRRFFVIQWNRIFKEDEKDRGLTDYLTMHEMPAIAAWAVRGAERLLARGAFTVPPSADKALEQWRVDVDPVAAFLRDCTTPQPGGPGTPSSALYATFKAWLGDNGHRLMSVTSFGRRLRAHGYPAQHQSDGNYYYLRLTVPVPISHFLS